MKYLLFILILFLAQPPATLYVAPYGTEDAEGTPEEPTSLNAALAQGGNIWLLPGTYKGDFRIDVPDTSLRSVPGTRARIDGDVQVRGAGSTLENLELTYTGWQSRISAYPGSNPPDIAQKRLSIYAPGVRIRNNVIHDLANVGWWQTAIDSEMSGNLIFNNGWRGTDKGWGEGIYAQNGAGGDKLLHNNVIGPSYSMIGLQFYGSALTSLKRLHAEQNIFIGTRFLMGGGAPVDDIHVIGNMLWKSAIEVGYTNPLNGSAEIRDNYVGMGSILPHKLTELDMQNNTVINYGGLALMDLTKPLSYTYVIENNTYLSNRPNVLWDDTTLHNFSSWQALGRDINGEFAPLPTTPKIFVRSTAPHRGYVAVYNWAGVSTVDIDLPPLALTPGASYKLVNALNPTESLSFTAMPSVSLPMAGWTVATPIGAAEPLTTWSNQFAVFLVEPQ